MSFLRNIILVFGVTLLMFSCKNKIIKENETYNVKDKLEKKNKLLAFKYFDTILNSEKGKGILKYDMNTKIKKSDIVERYIILYTLTGKENIELKNADDYMELDRKAQGAFLDTVGDGTFNFDYKFSKAGKQNLTIAFVELIDYRDTLSKKIKTAYFYSNTSVSVMVVDSNSVLGVKDKKIYFHYKRDTFVKRKDSLPRALINQKKIDSMKRALNN